MTRDWTRRKCPTCGYFVHVEGRRLAVHERWVGGSTKPVIDIGWPIRCEGSRRSSKGLPSAVLVGSRVVQETVR